MITPIADLPSYVAGFIATGEVTKEDYENVLMPEIERVHKEHGHIHFLFELRTKASDFTAGAWWNDAAIGLKHYSDWKKIAIVSDEQVIEKFTNLFSALLPGKSRGFTLGALPEAIQWVSAES